MPQGPFFFCLKHHTVEPKDGCAERHRLGPYATQAEAEQALSTVAERNAQQDAEDRRWAQGGIRGRGAGQGGGQGDR